jgi:hypothetical protein
MFLKKLIFFYFLKKIYVLNRINTLISNIILKIFKKNIILIYFDIKITLKKSATFIIFLYLFSRFVLLLITQEK